MKFVLSEESQVVNAQQNNKLIYLRSLHNGNLKGHELELFNYVYGKYSNIFNLSWIDEEDDIDYIIEKINDVMTRREYHFDNNRILNRKYNGDIKIYFISFSNVKLVLSSIGESIWERDAEIKIEGLIVNENTTTKEADKAIQLIYDFVKEIK
jgi:hypothetical protein